MHVVMITDFPDDLDHPGGGLEATAPDLCRFGMKLCYVRRHGEFGLKEVVFVRRFCLHSRSLFLLAVELRIQGQPQEVIAQ